MNIISISVSLPAKGTQADRIADLEVDPEVRLATVLGQDIGGDLTAIQNHLEEAEVNPGTPVL